MPKEEYSSVAVAKYIAAYCNDKKIDINITKIQKLTYIAYGTWLVIKNGKRLFDEHPEAWPYGPVFPTTRRKLLKLDLKSINFNDDDLKDIKNDNEIDQLITTACNFFGNWTAKELSEWSHEKYSPWEKTVLDTIYNNGDTKPKWGATIEDKYIQSYFKNVVINHV